MRIFGIVNVTRDSFSDGGRFLQPADAIAHGARLAAAGADVLDVGAESTHPDAEDVAAAEEIARLRPVVASLRAAGHAVSVDTCKPEVMAAMLELGVEWLNDVHGFRSAAAMEVVRRAPQGVRFVAMFSRSASARADRGDHEAATVVDELRAFCAERIAAFAAAGVARERLVLDPGMGFFLGRAPACSLRVLHRLDALEREFGPLLVSVSRKSFLGAVADAPAASVAWIRTHDVKALRDGLAVERAIEAAR